MTTINNLPAATSVSSSDKLAIYANAPGRTRNVAIQELSTYLKTVISPTAISFNSSTKIITLTLGDGTIITGTVDNGGAIVPGTFELAGSSVSGAYISTAMPASFTQLFIASFQFFNAAAVQVAPTAGTVTITASNDGVNYFAVSNGVFNGTDVYLPSRPQTSAVGPVTFIKVTLSGITGNGVTSFKTLITRA